MIWIRQKYDGALQMFVDEPKPVSLAHVGFMRWLMDQGRLEHEPAGPPSGRLMERTPSDEPSPCPDD